MSAISAATAATGWDFPYRADTKSATVVTFCALGEIGDAGDERRSEADHQNGPDVNRQKIEPVLGSEPDRPVVGPGRAIDGETERVDDRPRAARSQTPSPAVAPPGDEKQQEDVADGG